MLMTSRSCSKIIDAVVRSASTLKSGRSGSSASGRSSSLGTIVEPGVDNISSGDGNGDTVGNGIVCDDRELVNDRDADDASSSSGASG